MTVSEHADPRRHPDRGRIDDDQSHGGDVRRLALTATQRVTTSVQDGASPTGDRPGHDGEWRRHRCDDDLDVTHLDGCTSTSTDSTSAAGTRSYDFSMISPVVQEFVDERQLEGAGLVVVDEQDGIVHEEYWGEFSHDRVSLIASSSKMIVAGVLMALDDQGLLDIDAPVADVVEWGVGNPRSHPPSCCRTVPAWSGCSPTPRTRRTSASTSPRARWPTVRRRSSPPNSTTPTSPLPDTEFRYGGAQWQVAGAVAEAASGRSWAQLIDDTYIEPCGVESLGFNNQWTQFPGGLVHATRMRSTPIRPHWLRPTTRTWRAVRTSRRPTTPSCS